MEVITEERTHCNLKGRNFKKPLINLLLREAGSSPFALKHSLLNMESGENGQEIKEIVCNEEVEDTGLNFQVFLEHTDRACFCNTDRNTCLIVPDKYKEASCITAISYNL